MAFEEEENKEIQRRSKIRLAEVALGVILKDLEESIDVKVDSIEKMETFGVMHYRIKTTPDLG